MLTDTQIISKLINKDPIRELLAQRDLESATDVIEHDKHYKILNQILLKLGTVNNKVLPNRDIFNEILDLTVDKGIKDKILNSLEVKTVGFSPAINTLEERDTVIFILQDSNALLVNLGTFSNPIEVFSTTDVDSSTSSENWKKVELKQNGRFSTEITSEEMINEKTLREARSLWINNLTEGEKATYKAEAAAELIQTRAVVMR